MTPSLGTSMCHGCGPKKANICIWVYTQESSLAHMVIVGLLFEGTFDLISSSPSPCQLMFFPIFRRVLLRNHLQPLGKGWRHLLGPAATLPSRPQRPTVWQSGRLTKKSAPHKCLTRRDRERRLGDAGWSKLGLLDLFFLCVCVCFCPF